MRYLDDWLMLGLIVLLTAILALGNLVFLYYGELTLHIVIAELIAFGLPIILSLAPGRR